MGSQRRRVQRLMQSFNLSEEEAYELEPTFAALDLEDELSDAVYFVETGKVDSGIKRLHDLVANIAAGVVLLQRSIDIIRMREDEK